MVEGLEKRIEIQDVKNAELEAKNAAIMSENAAIMSQNAAVMSENARLRARVTDLENETRQLREASIGVRVHSFPFHTSQI